jgi:hypothetical protein
MRLLTPHLYSIDHQLHLYSNDRNDHQCMTKGQDIGPEPPIHLTVANPPTTYRAAYIHIDMRFMFDVMFNCSCFLKQGVYECHQNHYIGEYKKDHGFKDDPLSNTTIKGKISLPPPKELSGNMIEAWELARVKFKHRPASERTEVPTETVIKGLKDLYLLPDVWRHMGGA